MYIYTILLLYLYIFIVYIVYKPLHLNASAAFRCNTIVNKACNSLFCVYIL